MQDGKTGRAGASTHATQQHRHKQSIVCVTVQHRSGHSAAARLQCNNARRRPNRLLHVAFPAPRTPHLTMHHRQLAVARHEVLLQPGTTRPPPPAHAGRQHQRQVPGVTAAHQGVCSSNVGRLPTARRVHLEPPQRICQGDEAGRGQSLLLLRVQRACQTVSARQLLRRLMCRGHMQLGSTRYLHAHRIPAVGGACRMAVDWRRPCVQAQMVLTRLCALTH